ncbi:hypothetical protein IscW_ISCW000272, partial [Ixodes scapularis]
TQHQQNGRDRGKSDGVRKPEQDDRNASPSDTPDPQLDNNASRRCEAGKAAVSTMRASS